ncbi:MAG: arginine--tRNA ligase [Candidatus Micrarchaeia archaeon]
MENQELTDAVTKALLDACIKLKYKITESEIAMTITEAKPEFGDMASTIAFSLAKKLQKNPTEIASAIASKTKTNKIIETVKAVGPYINFTFGSKVWTDVIKSILEQRENFGKGHRQEKVSLEYPSVNPNKPWHIGHLRNALIGNSLSNILEFSGCRVERQNYINDLGLQVAQSIWGYMTLPEPQPPEKKFDHLLGKQYIEIAKQEEKVEPEVRRLLKKMEDRDPKISARAREITERCVRAQLETAFNYGIYEDVMIWESDIIESHLFDKGIEKLKNSGILEKKVEGEHSGCMVVPLDEKEFSMLKSDAKVIIRSDGTATYTAKDVAFAMWKFGLLDKKFKYKTFERQPNNKPLLSTASKGKEMEFGKADIVINIIDVRQSYLQQLIKYILKKLGYQQAENYIHVAYETVSLPGGEFSGRLGTWVGYTADELLEEGTKRAAMEIEKRLEKSGIKGREKDKIAKQIAKAAIKFSFLRISHSRQVVFDWSRALSFEGDSGPYLQYACVRANKIIMKAETEKLRPGISAEYKFNPAERQLVKLLQKFPSIVEKSARDFQTYYIAEYGLDLADAFNKFYESSPVLRAEREEEKKARLALVSATSSVLKSALGLLGIEVPEKM